MAELPKKKKSLFSDHRTFPRFLDLPRDDDICASFKEYYRLGQRSTIERARTWCFLAEIITVTAPFSTPVLHHFLVRDRTGKELPVYFYPECGSFDYTELRVGRTVAILFAERHDFLDLSMGVRIENLDTLRVINCSLSDLFEISRCHARNGEERCWNAECEEVKPPDTIMKCGSCRCARYCNKECQTKDWTERHKRWCKALPMFLKLVTMDYTRVTTWQ